MPMFWDLGLRSLELRALESIKAHDEIRGDAFAARDALTAMVARQTANAEYRRLSPHFGDRDGVNAMNFGRALAAFERTPIGPNSAFDRYVRG